MRTTFYTLLAFALSALSILGAPVDNIWKRDDSLNHEKRLPAPESSGTALVADGRDQHIGGDRDEDVVGDLRRRELAIEESDGLFWAGGRGGGGVRGGRGGSQRGGRGGFEYPRGGRGGLQYLRGDSGRGGRGRGGSERGRGDRGRRFRKRTDLLK
ncbi:hypothetical protein BDD12DRAFT_805345 [Trichophaea hybrida]|nr:hypothetical protein BDD12DRAFT_805345 [Trichophaea hybrida]